MVAGIICALIEGFSGAETPAASVADSKLAGTIFIIVFLLNILVISFDFPGIKAVALALFITAAVLGLLYLDSKTGILGPLTEWTKQLFEGVCASAMMYSMVSAILAIMIFGGIMVNYLWNRWTIEPNRLMHKHGILGDVREYPVIDLQLHKSIDDVFEYALLLSGSLTFQPNPSTTPIRLENVAFINRAEKRIQGIIRKHHAV